MKTNYSSSHRESPQPARRQRRSSFRSGLSLILIGIFLAFLFSSCKPTPPSDPVSVVQTAYDRLNQDDVDGYMEFLSDDAVMVDRSGRYAGAEAIRTSLELNFVPYSVRFELSNISSDGDVVTYTVKVFEDDKLVATYDDGIDVIADGKIIFDGTKGYLKIECNQDPSQAFCPED